MRNRTKIDTSKLEVLPVPDGFKMKYRHHYREVKGAGDVTTKILKATDAWLENNENGEIVATETAHVNKKDTPNKKLGRIIAHNRCIKAWQKMVDEARNQR
jgi:hypothetical protein